MTSLRLHLSGDSRPQQIQVDRGTCVQEDSGQVPQGQRSGLQMDDFGLLGHEPALQAVSFPLGSSGDGGGTQGSQASIGGCLQW